MHNQSTIIEPTHTPASATRFDIGCYLAAGLLLMLATAACNTASPAGGGTVDDNRVAGLPAEDTARFALQSQCGQAVIECTSDWPIPRINVLAGDGQTVTATETGFLVQGSDANGQELVQLIGSNSSGTGTKDPPVDVTLSFSWTSLAIDTDPCTLDSGDEFSTDVDPVVLLEAGFHYIRLSLANDILQAELVLADCDTTLQDVPSFDFLEIEIEVRD